MGVKVDLHGSPSFSVCRYLRGLLGITVEEWLQSRVKRLGLFQVRQVPSPSDPRQRSASNVSDQELSGRGGLTVSFSPTITSGGTVMRGSTGRKSVVTMACQGCL